MAAIIHSSFDLPECLMIILDHAVTEATWPHVVHSATVAPHDTPALHKFDEAWMRRHLLLLQLWSLLFPASDRRHQVMTPLAVTIGRCLSLCPLQRSADILPGAYQPSCCSLRECPCTCRSPYSHGHVAGSSLASP